jgi:S1-C subfamily serine protease
MSRCWICLGGAVALIAAFFASIAVAEFRTWTAAAGGFTTEAEFIELKGGTVRLRLKDGTALDIAIEKLSTADQQFARRQAAKTTSSKSTTTGPQAASPSAASGGLAKLEAQVARCHTAEEALRLYRVFRDDPSTSEADRKAIEPKLAEVRELAEKKMVRMQGKWVTEEEFRKVREQANELMRQGLELLRLKQEDGFRKKYAEAAALEPDSIRADFGIGMLYAAYSADYTKTKQYFENCLKREPKNVCVLNNLALAYVKRGDVGNAVTAWRKAIEIEPSQSIVQNLGRFIDKANRERIKASKSQLDYITNIYSELVTSGKYDRANLKRGWIWMLLDQELLSLQRKTEAEEASETVSNVPPPGEDGSVVIGGVTGFVVSPEYVLTSQQVTESITSFEIQTSDGSSEKTLPTTVVAKSTKPDLVLLHCKGLQAAPLAIDPGLCGRGTDILALGYPEAMLLGASLKATRGVISAVPSASMEDMYLYDAVVNFGNSGGPVFDKCGNVIAVTTAMIRTEVQYGGAIPAAKALDFIKRNLTGYTEPPLSKTPLEWPVVDKQASPSTVLVWVRSKTPGASRTGAGANFYEDRDCLVCNGTRLQKCTYSKCINGIVTSSGKREVCRRCEGRGALPCSTCKGTGTDPDLAPPKKPRSATSPSTPTPGMTTQTQSWRGLQVVRSTVMDDFLRISPGGQALTAEEYAGPIEIAAKARTDSTNIRLYAHGKSLVIWNWELNQSELRVHRPDGTIASAPTTPLVTNRWYNLRWVIHSNEMSVYVDDRLVFKEVGSYALDSAFVRIAGSHGSTIDIESLTVKKL